MSWGEVGKILEGGYRTVSRLAGTVHNAKGVLRRVQSIADDVSRCHRTVPEAVVATKLCCTAPAALA